MSITIFNCLKDLVLTAQKLSAYFLSKVSSDNHSETGIAGRKIPVRILWRKSFHKQAMFSDGFFRLPEVFGEMAS